MKQQITYFGPRDTRQENAEYVLTNLVDQGRIEYSEAKWIIDLFRDSEDGSPERDQAEIILHQRTTYLR